MTDHGVVTEAGAIRFERMLPGPIDQVWAYLTQSDKRALWLAAWPMDLRPGGEMELIWRNDDLARPDETPPEKYAGYGGEHRMKGHVVRVEPPRLLVHTWDEEEGGDSEVVSKSSARGSKAASRPISGPPSPGSSRTMRSVSRPSEAVAPAVPPSHMSAGR